MPYVFSYHQGQTPFDVADEGLVEHLEMLQKKQSVVSSQLFSLVSQYSRASTLWLCTGWNETKCHFPDSCLWGIKLNILQLKCSERNNAELPISCKHNGVGRKRMLYSVNSVLVMRETFRVGLRRSLNYLMELCVLGKGFFSTPRILQEIPRENYGSSSPQTHT